MILRIAGISHFDPLGRQRLSDWLKQTSRDYGRPAFVATEWDKDMFLRVKAQRGRFRTLLREQWPNISENLLGILTLSLGYEGDTHAEIYAGVEILWLDEGRDLPGEDVIIKYAEERLTRCREYLGEGPCGCDDVSTLARMSAAAAQKAGPPPDRGDDRDKKFADWILHRVEQGAGDWATVIVGKNHAMPTNGSMRRLLEDKKLVCKVAFL